MLDALRRARENPQELSPEGLLLAAVADLKTHIQSQDLLADVANFHKKFGISYEGKPRKLTGQLQRFRLRALEEELQEYRDAVKSGDLAEQFDALIDLLYFLLGTIHLHGFPLYEGFRRVHEANMKKVLAGDASDSKRGYALDLVKPEGWQPPVLEDLVNEA